MLDIRRTVKSIKLIWNKIYLAFRKPLFIE